MTIKSTSKQLMAGVTLTFLAISGCTPPSSDVDAPAANTGTLNVYSARHYDVDDELFKRFTESTGIDVNVVEGKSDELIERITTEGENSPADIFMTVDAGRLWRAEEAGIFQPVSSAALDQAVPANLRHPDGLWYGLTKRARVLVYNPSAVTPADLSTYEALAEPEWAGRVCVRSSGNIYNQSLLGSMIETEGVEATEEWAQGLVNNFARQPDGGDVAQIEAVASGQCDVAIVNHYYWARLAKSDDAADQDVISKTAVFFPNQDGRGTHVNISGVGVVAGAENQENAIAFLEFLMSPLAQTVFAQSNNEYPVVEGIDVDPVVSELGDFKVDEVNVSAYGRNNPEVVKLVDRVGWE